MRSSTDQDQAHTVSTLLREIIDGPTSDTTFVLTADEPGLLQSLDQLSAAEASTALSGGYTIAGRVEELRLSLAILNRSRRGENPFVETGVRLGGRRMQVNESLWRDQLARLREQMHGWIAIVNQQPMATELDVAGVVAMAAYVAYHLGALRQMHGVLPRQLAGDASYRDPHRSATECGGRVLRFCHRHLTQNTPESCEMR